MSASRLQRSQSVPLLDDEQYYLQIENILSKPLSREKIAKASEAFAKASRAGAFKDKDPFGELSCSYATWERSATDYGKKALTIIDQAIQEFVAARKDKLEPLPPLVFQKTNVQPWSST